MNSGMPRYLGQIIIPFQDMQSIFPRLILIFDLNTSKYGKFNLIPSDRNFFQVFMVAWGWLLLNFCLKISGFLVPQKTTELWPMQCKMLLMATEKRSLISWAKIPKGWALRSLDESLRESPFSRPNLETLFPYFWGTRRQFGESVRCLLMVSHCNR